MTDHNGVLTMQRLLLAGALGMTMARKAAAILEGGPASDGELASDGESASVDPLAPVPQLLDGQRAPDPRSQRARCCGRSWTRPTSAWGTSTTGRRASGGATRCSTCSTWPLSPPTWARPGVRRLAAGAVSRGRATRQRPGPR